MGDRVEILADTRPIGAYKIWLTNKVHLKLDSFPTINLSPLDARNLANNLLKGAHELEESQGEEKAVGRIMVMPRVIIKARAYTRAGETS